MRERTSRLAGTVAISACGMCCIVVMGVGAVAIAAEFAGTWSHYFILEQTVATVTPLSMGLLALAIVTGLVAASFA